MTDARKLLPRIAIWLASLTVLAGLCIIAGWQFRIPVLKGEALGTFVAPNTALCFVLCGVSILLQVSGGRWRPDLGAIIGVFVTVFSLATAAEYAFQTDLGIDRLFMAHRLSDWFLPLPGRFVLNTAIGFTLSGISLVTLRSHRRSLSEYFSVPVLLVSYLSLIAYLYGATKLYSHVMAVHTAVLFGIMGIALLAAPPRPAIADTLLSPFTGAVASRKMIIAVIILLPAFGAMQLWAEEGKLVTLRFGVALSVIAFVVVFTALAVWTASSLNEADRKKAEIETALLRSGQIAAAGRMAASIAHEINNPLEAITNIIYLLKNDGIPQDFRKKYLDTAESELIRVAAIARRTLGFYRDETKPTQFDLCALIDGVLEIYRNKLEGYVTVRRLYTVNAQIIAKGGEIRQVISNLIANAIDSMHGEAGRLDVTVAVSGKVVTVEIADNGCGIAEQHLQKIFDPFFTTKKDVGTGLGLWVSRELVARNNGIIAVNSSTASDNRGTMFKLTFPLAASTASPAPVAEEPLRAESTSH
jgi:signal transduction histidine kinase